jgi:hypothetical protein
MRRASLFGERADTYNGRHEQYKTGNRRLGSVQRPIRMNGLVAIFALRGGRDKWLD